MTPLDLLLNVLLSFQEGRALLTAGRYEWKFPTRSAPSRVYVGEAPGNVPVCQGDVNAFGVTLLPDGFILHADVKTDTTEIEWQAILSPAAP